MAYRYSSAVQEEVSELLDQVPAFGDGGIAGSNVAQAAGLAAVDLRHGWRNYGAGDPPEEVRRYQTADVEAVIRILQAWSAAGCPGPTTKG